MTGAVVSHLLQSTLFAGAVALVTLGFRRNGAKVRFWLWFCASVKFCVPFSLLMMLGNEVVWAPARGSIAVRMGAPVMRLVASPMGLPADTVVGATTARPETRGLAAFAWLGVWGLGLAGVAWVRFRDWGRIRAALRASRPVDVAAAVEVRCAPGLLEPGVVGLVRPVLLLPQGIAEHLTPAQLRAVVAHEVCHVRRRDNLYAAIHMVVEAAFWFHPLVWWLGARLVEERERACDEEVLSLGGDPREYAEGIVSICKLYVESPLACVSGVTGANLRKRIEAIMANHRTRALTFTQKAVLTFAGLLVVAAPLVLGVMNAPLARAQTAAPRFEAAAIRSCSGMPGLKGGAGYSVSDGRLNTGCMSLAEADHTGLIQRAYVRFAGGQQHRTGLLPITGGPEWIRSERFDIEARADGQPSEDLMQGPMLQALLEEQFRLKIRRESRAVAVYALTVEAGPSRLKAFAAGSCVPMPLKMPLPELPAGQEYCKTRVGVQPPTVDAQGSTLAEFAQMLDLVLDRPVVDRTGLGGQYDIHIRFGVSEATPRYLPGGDLARFVDAAQSRNAPSIFAALQELGLKLEPAQGSREFLVVEHVERPTAR
ncbi:M56 family metallopeptidase [Paludibaculum fermentans]|uniref:M56 family metallopeptidase n=1 Tax=Paludibaculum fermentans TaxID=1473598 RepID=UPI003EC0A117